MPLRAIIQSAVGVAPAHLCDLGKGGAQIKTTGSLKDGQRVVLRCGNLAVGARVAWRDGVMVGLRFLETPNENDLLYALHEAELLSLRRMRRMRREAGGPATAEQ